MLIYFSQMFRFSTPWRCQKTKIFVKFSRDIEENIGLKWEEYETFYVQKFLSNFYLHLFFKPEIKKEILKGNRTFWKEILLKKYHNNFFKDSCSVSILNFIKILRKITLLNKMNFCSVEYTNTKLCFFSIKEIF